MANLEDVALLGAIGALANAETDVNNDRVVFQQKNAFQELNDHQFIKIYRLSKPVATELVDLLEPHLTPPTRLSALYTATKVLAALRFFAAGSYQSVLHGISQPSVSRAIDEVTNALNTPGILNSYIKLPGNAHELQQTRAGFFEKFNFPGVMGCIDCTHVAIFPPKREIEHIFVNRKSYHSINTQLICDSDLKIMNVCARYPGSTNDSFIWRNSAAFTYMTDLHRRGATDYLLLGDSGYALRPWLMTPLDNVEPGSPGERYNNCHKQARCPIERCNGVFEMRFRCLLKYKALHYKPEKCCNIINACCVLHNLCIQNNVPLQDEEGGPEPEPDLGISNIRENLLENIGGPRANVDLLAGRQVQQRIIRNYF